MASQIRATIFSILFCGVLAFCLVLCHLSYGSAQTNQDLQTSVQQKRTGSLEKRILDLEKEIKSLRGEINGLQFPAPPETLSLCDAQIPLGRDDVRERFEREFFLILQDRGLLTIVNKRHSKFLSLISNELDRLRMPTDLIYLAIAESYLDPRVVSSAGAGGMWQFIKETGKREGLFISDLVDERYSVGLSTRSALNHLRRLYTEFGDWLLALAAYNCGAARVREAISNQNTRNFFDLFLPPETERYVMRIAVFKELIRSPGKYGIASDVKEQYRPYSVCDLIIVTAKDVHTSELAQAADLPYKAFRDCNLHIRRYSLSKGSYHIFIPTEKREIFLRKIRTVPGVSIEKAN